MLRLNPPKVNRVRRLLVGPLVVFFLSMGLTFGTGTAAHAYASPPKPLTIGPVIKAAPIRMLSMTSPVGLAVNTAVFGGMLLYETRDSWLPVVEGLINGGSTSNEGGNGPYWCEVDVTAIVAVGRTVEADVKPYGDCGANANQGVTLFVDQATCTAADGSTVSNVTGSGGTNTFPGVKVHVVANVGCAVGSTVTAGRVRASYNTGGVLHYSDYYRLAPGYPAEETVTTTTIQCKQPDGTLTSITDTLTGYADRLPVPSCADRVPGSIPWAGTVKAGPEGGTQKDIWSFSTNQSVKDEYADCFGPSGLQCDIRVYVDGQPCVVDMTGCRYWKDLAQSAPSRVTCRFGSYVVALTQCEPLRKAYLGPQTITKTDPATGEPVEEAAPPGESGTGTFPTTGVNPQGPAAVPDDSTDPDTQGCFGEAWSWNPIDWVYVPVKCSLLWAFKPPPGYADAKMAELRTTLEGTSPWKYSQALDDVFTVPAGTSGCGGIEFDPPLPGLTDAESPAKYIGAACPGDSMADAAGMVKPVATACIYIFGAFACIKNVLAGFGIGVRTPVDDDAIWAMDKAQLRSMGV